MLALLIVELMVSLLASTVNLLGAMMLPGLAYAPAFLCRAVGMRPPAATQWKPS